ncbi:MAG: hypothetical protein ACI92Z_002861 [Paracoccaceae bacterium]|jgi:hypothetical protein
MSAYRLVDSQLTPITNEIELAEIEAAQNQISSVSVSSHINAAVELYSNREKPNYRNSIKEAISAVEAAAKDLAGSNVKTLGDALKLLGRTDKLHSASETGNLKLYGGTNDSYGILHAMMDQATVTETDARYMLVSCSAFSNYLVSKK